MNRRALGALAIVIILLMVVVATAGLDSLPRSLRGSIAAAGTHFDADRAQFTRNSDVVTRALADEPALFRTKAASYRERLDRDNACFALAATELAALRQLAKEDKRSEAARAESELAKFDTQRNRCSQDASDMRVDVERWVQYKHELPQRLAAMKSSYDLLHSFDVDAAVAPARKAEADWPAKKDDLESRISQLPALKLQGEQAWDSTAKLRSAAEANHLDDFDYATFFDQTERMDGIAKRLKEGADGVNLLAGQLYTSWDKLVLNVETQDGAREKVRTVRTRYKDATLAGGDVSSDERWENVDAAQARQAERNEGMVVARKPAGKYDSETERVVQPPAIAYVAPPGQSNAYGAWNNGVWSWLPQYLILRELLNASRGPITYGDYGGWDQARRRGETYYGREGFGWWHSRRSVPSGTVGGGGVLDRARQWANSRSSGSVGSSGGREFYQERPKTYGGSGGFSGSQYKSRGAFSGSRYQSRGGFGSFSSRGFSGGGRSFSRGGRR